LLETRETFAGLPKSLDFLTLPRLSAAALAVERPKAFGLFSLLTTEH
jgi:hypothetical protein